MMPASIESHRGRFWLILDGEETVSKGVNHVSYDGDFAPKLGYSPYRRAVESTYGDARRWAESAAARLQTWGFNTVGLWSSKELWPYLLFFVSLDFAASFGSNWQTGEVADVFLPEFADRANKKAGEIIPAVKDDPNLIGYFTDNELRWGPDWRGPEHLLDIFLKKSGPGHDLAVEMSQGHPLGEARELFLRAYARRYFDVSVAAIKAYDPQHLVLGARLAHVVPSIFTVAEAMGSLDAIAFNDYSDAAPLETMRKLHSISGKPIMITEFSFKAMDSGLPNSRGGGRPVKDQAERASRTKAYLEAILREPYVIGYHWFQWSDEPKEGRFDGEDCNYGLVKINDEPWPELVKAFSEVNWRAEELHEEAT
ncbi:beta-agarase [Tardisphaera miroshnichenkoae]